MILVNALLGCGPAPPCNDALDTLLHDLAGPDATYCGTADGHDDPVPVDECVVEAFQNQASFYARYEWFDTDAGGTDAWASDGTTVWKINASIGLVKGGEGVSYAPCYGPRVTEKEDNLSGKTVVRHVLACDDLGPSDDVRCRGIFESGY